MDKQGLLSRIQVFMGAATVAAHANAVMAGDGGFRQRDVRFLFELFTNWVELSLSAQELGLQNTHIARFLQWLSREGYARQLRTREGPPRYRLSRIGLIELLSRMVQPGKKGSRESFFFVYFFVSSYRARIAQLVRMEGRQFPPALQVELESLLDEDEFLEHELRDVAKELLRLETRIHDAVSTSALTKKMKAVGSSFEEIVKTAEREHPYELNSQKPLHELLNDIPDDQRQWELEVGNVSRAHCIWQPQLEILRVYQAQLIALQGYRVKPNKNHLKQGD